MPRRIARPPAAQEWLALDHQLCFALYSASLAMTKLYKPLLAPLGITYPQYLVMLVLWEGDGITVSQLGVRLTLDSGTLTPLLKRLEALGLLRRLRDATDERRVLLQLTRSGRALEARAVQVPQAVACASGCALDELLALTTRLTALRTQLTETLPRAAWGRAPTPSQKEAPWPSKKPSTPPTPHPPADAPARPNRRTARSS